MFFSVCPNFILAEKSGTVPNSVGNDTSRISKEGSPAVAVTCRRKSTVGVLLATMFHRRK